MRYCDKSGRLAEIIHLKTVLSADCYLMDDGFFRFFAEILRNGLTVPHIVCIINTEAADRSCFIKCRISGQKKRGSKDENAEEIQARSGEDYMHFGERIFEELKKGKNIIGHYNNITMPFTSDLANLMDYIGYNHSRYYDTFRCIYFFFTGIHIAL